MKQYPIVPGCGAINITAGRMLAKKNHIRSKNILKCCQEKV
jgi:hypothetical protein